MDKILNDPFGYNDRLGRRLYDEYFADDDSADNEFDKALKRLIGPCHQENEHLERQARPAIERT